MNTIAGVSADRVLASVAFKIIDRAFSLQPSEARKCFRLSNFTANEAMTFLDICELKTRDGSLKDTNIVVASDAPAKFPDHYRARTDETITTYRNSIDPGHALIYIETKIESDSQGLKNIFTLRDNNFLDGSFDSEDFQVSRKLAVEAFNVVFDSFDSTYDPLVDGATEVLEGLKSGGMAVSVRKYSRFCLLIAERRKAIDGVVDLDQVNEIVGASLPALDLFPDSLWRENKTKTRISRRLTQNHLHADLASSSTADLDQQKLAQDCKTVKFKDPNGEVMPECDQTPWRELCSSYCADPVAEIRSQIPYQIFEQLFSRDVKGLKLGDRIREEVDEQSSDRLQEFDGLDIKTGLNSRNSEDAIRLLETECDDELLPPIRDLLSKATRRMIEKLAYPKPQRFENPLTTVADLSKIFRRRSSSDLSDKVMSIRLSDRADPKSPSVGLFAFLYGSTLRSVCEDSRNTSKGMLLDIDDNLTQPMQPPPILDRDPEKDEEAAGDEDAQIVEWGPVPLEFVLLCPDTKKVEDAEPVLEWCPTHMNRLALFWLLTTAEDRPEPVQQLKIPMGMSTDDWVDHMISRTTSLTSCATDQVPDDVLAHDVVGRLMACTGEFRTRCTTSGLSVSVLADHYDNWNELLGEAKRDFIPQNKKEPHVDAILLHECVQSSGGGSLLMLASHPLRTRWIAQYLRKSEELAINALNSDLPLNPQNESRYLDWIADLSPHQHPPVHLAPDQQRLLAVREAGWTEEFSPLRSNSSLDESTSVSSSVLREIHDQILTYLIAHPYKQDGLSILIVSPGTPKLPAEVAEGIRKGTWRDVKLTIHFATAKEHWGRATTYFEAVHSENRLFGNNSLFPPQQLMLYALDDGRDLREQFGDLQVDIAVVPQFLHGKETIQEQTVPDTELGGAFDPLLDRPTFIHGGDNGGVITVAQRPRNPDAALNNWSTLVVRQHRMSPVAREQPENIDLFELRIDFHKAAELFEVLHACAHWVVTFERYITRAQIEGLKNKPSVMSIKDGIGPGGALTLIVSSDVGQQLIVNRLERKLARIVEASGLTRSNARAIRDIAEMVFDETRKIAPRLTLKAMGISRATEEILGLMVGRRIIDQEFTVNMTSGLTAWISFDDHQEWFGGESGVRADLCRITLDRVDGHLFVDIVVLEAKLRSTGYEPYGVKQVKAAMDLLRGTMPLTENGEDQKYVDAELWREGFLSAIETVNSEAVQSQDLHTSSDESVHRIPEDIRSDFRRGNFSLRTFEGVYSVCVYGDSGELKLARDEDDSRITVARSCGTDLLNLAGNVVGGKTTPPTTFDALHHAAAASNDTGDTASDIEADQQDVVAPFDTEQAVDSDNTAASTVRVDNLEAENSDTTRSNLKLRKLTDAELEKRYQSILNVYGEFGIKVHSTENAEDRFVEGPASVLYRLRRGHGVQAEKIMQQGTALKLELKLQEEQGVKFGTDTGYITVDVPKLPADRIFVSATDLWDRWERSDNGLVVPLGIDRYGSCIDIDFSSSNSPHLLIGGTTGSGKSEALNTLLAGLINFYRTDELRLLLVDPKGTELTHLSDSAYLEGEIGWDSDDALKLLDDGVTEMERRYQIFKTARQRSLPEFNAQAAADDRLPWWVIVLDEYADLTSDKDAKKQIEDKLRRLAQKARAAGIHLVIATQKPGADVISTNLRSNLPAQLALRVKSATESRVVMDEAGAETLNGMGDAYLKCAGKTTRIQCAKS